MTAARQQELESTVLLTSGATTSQPNTGIIHVWAHPTNTLFPYYIDQPAIDGKANTDDREGFKQDSFNAG